MSDPSPQQALPAFAPVPRDKARSNGWKPEVQRQFIEALAETGSVKAACRRVGRADHGAYLLRRHPEAGEFRRAWDIALELGMRRIEDIAMDRAINGVETPVYSYGKLVGSRTVYNDRLLMFMLRNRAPDRFAAGQAKALNALDAQQIKKLKAEWIADYQRQQAIAAGARSVAHGQFVAMRLDEMHRKWFTTLGPEARAAYRRFREAELADAARQRENWYAPYAQYAADNAREDLDQAADEWEAEDAREALAQAEAEHAAWQAEQQAAEADYAEWFDHDVRAKVWKAIDVVFGTIGQQFNEEWAKGEEEDGEEEV